MFSTAAPTARSVTGRGASTTWQPPPLVPRPAVAAAVLAAATPGVTAKPAAAAASLALRVDDAIRFRLAW